MKILILEDALIGETVLAAAVAHGLQGKCFVGVKSLQGTKLTGFCREGLKEEVVELTEFNLAFVDGFLYIGGMMGWQVLPQLEGLMPTIGTSSMGDIGANLSIDKDDMLSTLNKIIAGELTLNASR